jgi:hypothetical protein
MAPGSADYPTYLQRFAHALGPMEVGGYGKWNGQLIKKLSAEEFMTRNAEYQQLLGELERTFVAGHTINNRLLRQLRERAAELVLPPPG